VTLEVLQECFSEHMAVSQTVTNSLIGGCITISWVKMKYQVLSHAV
jgi:hypothetical protein